MTTNNTQSANAAPSTPDPIQAAAMECATPVCVQYIEPPESAEAWKQIRRGVAAIIATAMRELVADETKILSSAVKELQIDRATVIRDRDRLEADNARLRERVAELEELVSDLNGSYDGGRLDMIADWHDARLKREGRDADLKSGRSDGAVIRATIGHIRELESQLAAARRDAERLDWLDDNMSCVGGGAGATYSFKTPADVECGMLRAAIDAAMQREGGK
jgi:hypothetical protein